MAKLQRGPHPSAKPGESIHFKNSAQAQLDTVIVNGSCIQNPQTISHGVEMPLTAEELRFAADDIKVARAIMA